ncbi:MAG: tRNA (N(6)-L-threonylcarbamoyladenosine(37)-C(2))-methylthiotransferase MtaB, partial [Spirochaetota bacterium]|nr:tRNA (N(6)-L-threonylcarbamoyladenosine(37)-C(2))-methylthiotransferase MtaB [Spirochaetota bacterium]
VREGTAAAAMSNQLAEQVKSDRSQRLRELSCKLNSSYNSRFIGRKLRVLSEKGLGEDLYTGHSENYLKVQFKDKSDRTGDFVDVIVDKVLSDGVFATIAG